MQLSSRLPSLSHGCLLRDGHLGSGRMEENLQRTYERATCGEWIFLGRLQGWKWYGGGSEWIKGCAILLRADPTQAGMAELADAADSKSAGPCGHGGSTPPPGT